MNAWARKQTAFTIVELLIVIVVIAILAAITVVAYTGIQDRARLSALQSAATQAAKKIAIYAVDNSDLYPQDESTFLTAAALSDTADIDYSYVTSSDRAHYCVSATSASNPRQSMAVTDIAGDQEGKCIRNLARGPSSEGATSTWSANGSNTVAPSTDYAKYGSKSLRITTTGQTNVGASQGGIAATAGKVYTLSGYVYFPSSFGGGIRACIWGAIVSTLSCSQIVGTPLNTWNFLSQSETATTTSSSGNLYFYNNYQPPSTGSIAYVDGVMFTEGSALYEFADGNSEGWVWDGTANLSSSFGPALLR